MRPILRPKPATPRHKHTERFRRVLIETESRGPTNRSAAHSLGRCLLGARLRYLLQFHAEKLLAHEKFIAVGEAEFTADAAVDPVPAVQVLKDEAPRLGHDARVRSGHVGVIFKNQVAGGAAQSRFRFVEFEFCDDFATQPDVLELGGEGSLLQSRRAPNDRAFINIPPCCLV